MYKFCKAFLDRFIALIGLIILCIPLLIVSLVIKIDSKGPAVFKQERIGKNQKPFMLYKFRTMKSTDVAFDINNPVIKDGNQNLTRVGKVLRKLKVDEFLQLINVLRGEMSLIGPRPLLGVYLDSYQPWELKKFDVKPGLSGLSQVSGNGYLKTQERSYYDVIYTKKISFLLDCKIFFKTIGVIFCGEKKFLKHVPQDEMDKIVSQVEEN